MMDLIWMLALEILELLIFVGVPSAFLLGLILLAFGGLLVLTDLAHMECPKCGRPLVKTRLTNAPEISERPE